jgi:UDP-N-acetylglucosamine 2-epimerase
LVARTPIAFVLGTRPEAIKLAPVILQVRRHCRTLRPVVVLTGQHPELAAEALAEFDLRPDHDLKLSPAGTQLAETMARCLSGVTPLLAEVRPGCVVVQGDTTSALAGAMAAFYQQIPVAHVEAGLRTESLAAPFPEEANRRLIARVAQLHFAPTIDAKANLLHEGIDPAAIHVTGNTVVDAMAVLRARVEATPSPVATHGGDKLVLVTAHRRENHGRPLQRICRAIRKLADRRDDLSFVFVTHPNPHAARPVQRSLGRCGRVRLIPPLPYRQMLRLVADSWLVLTDSGGLQEEAPSFGRPVLVLRDQTERTEGIAAGVARLVGTDVDKIVDAVLALLESRTTVARSTVETNPYGDGRAARRIVAALHVLIERTQYARRSSAGPVASTAASS